MPYVPNAPQPSPAAAIAAAQNHTAAQANQAAIDADPLAQSKRAQAYLLHQADNSAVALTQQARQGLQFDPRLAPGQNASANALASAGTGAVGAANPAQALSQQQSTIQALQQAGLANTVNQNAQMGQYGQDLGIVRQSALGNGPSAAQHLAQAQLDSGIQQQAALAAQARGGNLAGAMRQASQAGAQMTLQSQQQMAALRAQEQLNAQGLLGQGNAQMAGALATARGQDVGQAAAVNQAAGGLTQQNVALQGQGMQALGTAGGLYNQGVGQELQGAQQTWGQQTDAQSALNQILGTQSGLWNGLNSAQKTGQSNSSQQAGTFAGAGASALGSGAALFALSDKRVKTNIKPGDAALRDLLDKVSPYEYAYKDKAHGAADSYVSPMAQDLQRSKLGKGLVSTLPDGKMVVDYAKGFGAMLAGQAMLHAKLKKLETRSAA